VAKDDLNVLVLDLGLSISLWMPRSRVKKLGTEQCEDLLPNC